MPETNLNMPNLKKCAFCSYWYDPTNAAIRPINAVTGTWWYDNQMKSQCLLKGSNRKGGEFCNSFKMKL